MSASPDELEALVAVVFSRFIVEYRERQGEDIYLMRRALLFYESAPDAPTRPAGGSKTPFIQLGTERSVLREEWEELRHRARALARFPASVIEVLFPREYWGLLGRAIEDGPGEFAARSEAALHAYSRRTVRPTRARPEGGRLTLATVSNLTWCFRRIARTLVDLRGLEHPSPLLERWTQAPPIQPPSVAPNTTDRSAPPLRLVRRVLHELDVDIKRRLGCIDGDELAAIAAMSDTALRETAVFHRVKNRAVLALLATVGMRVRALAEMRFSDYDPAHRFPDENGTVGPAIRIRPAKSLHDKV